MDTKKLKTFEIGDGLKSIKMPSKYYSELEQGDTLLLYNPDNDMAWIRITVITVEPKDKDAENAMYQYIIDKGRKEERNIVTTNDKSYFVTKELSEQNGEKLIVNTFEIGYKCHFIIISVTTLSENEYTTDYEQILSEVSHSISTINEVSLEKSNLFELTYSDYKNIWKRVSDILGVEEDEIEKCHEKGTTIEILQKILNDEKYKSTDSFELQSLGIVLGDYLQYKYSNDYHWIIVRDEYGRDFALQYKNYLINLFPMTMISKRIEDGKKVIVAELIEGIMDTVERMIKTGNYRTQ